MDGLTHTKQLLNLLCIVYFKALLELPSVNIMFLVTSKMVSPNKPNSINFGIKIALNVIFQAKCFTCK